MIETIDSHPLSLVEFLNDSSQQTLVIERLFAQFSQQALQGFILLLPELHFFKDGQAVGRFMRSLPDWQPVCD